MAQIKTQAGGEQTLRRVFHTVRLVDITTFCYALMYHKVLVHIHSFHFNKQFLIITLIENQNAKMSTGLQICQVCVCVCMNVCVHACMCMCQTHSHNLGEVAQLEAMQQELQVSQLGGTGGQRGDMTTELTSAQPQPQPGAHIYQPLPWDSSPGRC